MQPAIFIIMFVLSLAQPAKAQSVDLLSELTDQAIPVYYSAGHEQRTISIAKRIGQAIAYHQRLLGFKPSVTLFVLSARDWSTHTTVPVVYGMPHYNEQDKRLIVAAEDNPFWKSFLPPAGQLPADLLEPMKSAYGDGDGHLSMQPFFDLLAIHELGHAFHMQGGLNMQRKWMGELFANILLHSFIAEKQPGSLPSLTLFPRMVVAGGTKEFKYTSLGDIEERYNEIGRKYPKNYGWYQCRWHSAAAGIYEAGGKQVCRRLWDALKNKKEILTDKELAGFLETEADKSVADLMRNWDINTKK